MFTLIMESVLDILSDSLAIDDATRAMIQHAYEHDLEIVSSLEKSGLLDMADSAYSESQLAELGVNDGDYYASG